MIGKDVSLRAFNTFGVDVAAAEFAPFRSVQDLRRALAAASYAPLILGGGSNLLLTRDLDRTVLHNEIAGIEVMAESARHVDIQVGSGVNWHELVMWAVDHDYGGIENLALIPGKVGAAPIQNIGAYGVELEEVFQSLATVDLGTTETVGFSRDDCRFGYRDSVFKQEAKGRYCITSVNLRLSKPPHEIHDAYGAIRETLARQEISRPGIRDICNAVIQIRSSKLPDPAQIGNSGSFFKNPVIPEAQWQALVEAFPTLVSYPDKEGYYKIPAGWLIDQCGWKGKRFGNVGCYAKQALVIVNYGGASGQEIYDHAMRVQASVEERFGIVLAPEVNIL
ncbi:MAG: UDP-N-acetylmuramate dehydrogenase [Saprospiraceae bacterium]|nr:UDP-N-acetylmuramate dehydrogenase [Saprospiraceae bacterium]